VVFDVFAKTEEHFCGRSFSMGVAGLERRFRPALPFAVQEKSKGVLVP